MATTINAADLLLSAGRTVIVSQPSNVTVTSTSINAVSVTASDQIFKFLAGSSTPTISSITLTATLTGTLTAYLWQYHNGTTWVDFSTSNTSSTYTLAYNNAAWSTTTLRVRCRSGNDLYTDEVVIAKLYDGTNGTNGNSVYVATVYQVSASALTAPVATASTYNFANNTLTPPSGWSVTQPATTTTPTYACDYTFSGTAGSTVTGTDSWSTPYIEAVNGTNGTNGEYRDIIELYLNSATAPTQPTSVPYTFTGNVVGTITGGTGGWSATQPTASTTPTYVTKALASTTTPGTAVTLTTWSTPTVIAQNGSTGATGLDAITTLMSNGTHTMPASASGAVTSYANSGTNIRVFEGTTELTYAASTLANSKFTVGTATVNPSGTGFTVGDYSASGSDPLASGLTGLAGKFFNGSWRTSISTGNIGTLPLTTANESSNVTGMAGGVQRFTSSILYGAGGDGNIGDTYGFIAIGYFKPPTTGNYYFQTRSDDYSGVWLGNIAVATSGRTAANATVDNGLSLADQGYSGQGATTRPVTPIAVSLNANTWYAIRIVHEEGNGGDGLKFEWSSNGSTWNTDLSQYFKVPAPDGSGSYNYTNTSSGILTMGSGSGGMDVAVHANMSPSTSALAITYPITVQRANGSQTSLSLVQNITKAVSGTSGTSYYMSPSAAAVRQAADGSYTPSSISFPTYSSVSGSNPTLLSSYYKLYLNGSGTATSSSGPTQSFSYTPTNTVTSIRVESFLDSGFATKIADITVPVTADGSRGSLTGYGNKYGISSGSWIDEVANRVINNMLTGSTDTSYMYSTSHLRVGDTVTLSSEQDQNAILPGVQGFAQTKFWTGSAWVLLGSVVDGNLLVNGTLAAEKITAGTITADRLTVTGRGGATILSDDPYFQDSSIWTRTSSNVGFVSGATTTGAVSSYYVSCTYGTDQYIESTRYYQISPNKTYNLSCNLFAAANNNRNIYIYVEFFTGSGSYLGHSITGWGGAKSGYVYGGTPTTSQFTRQGGRFGYGVSGRTIPSNAVQCRIGVWFQYAGFGSSQVEQAAQDLRLDEVLDGSTYIKDINADTITTGTLAADRINTNGLTIKNASGQVIFGAGVQPGNTSNILPDSTYADPLWWTFGNVPYWSQVGIIVNNDGSAANGQPHDYMQFNYSSGAKDLFSRQIPVIPGETYSLKIKVYVAAGTTGRWWAGIHLSQDIYWTTVPYVTYSSPENGVNISTGAWLTYEGTRTISTATNWCQTRLCFDVQSGYVEMHMELRKVADASLIADNAVTIDKLTAGKITIPTGDGASMAIGKDITSAGHHGITLDNTNFDNIFLRRSDGVKFFRLSQAGGAGHSLTWDSSSGVLAVGGDIVATGNIKTSAVSQKFESSTSGGQIILGFTVPANATGIIIDEALGPATAIYSAGCFPAGTLISVPGGKIPIEKIKLHDLIYAFDNDTKEIKLQKVTELFVHEWRDVGALSPLIKVTHEMGTISLTKNHLVYSDEKGVIAQNNKYVAVENLVVGDYLTLENNTKSRIVNIQDLPPYDKVYNLEVSGYHNYIADNVRVHNNGGIDTGSSGGGYTGKYGGSIVYGPILTRRTLYGGVQGYDNFAISNIKTGLQGYYELVVERMWYTGNMYVKVVILQR